MLEYFQQYIQAKMQWKVLLFFFIFIYNLS